MGQTVRGLADQLQVHSPYDWPCGTSGDWQRWGSPRTRSGTRSWHVPQADDLASLARNGEHQCGMARQVMARAVRRRVLEVSLDDVAADASQVTADELDKQQIEQLHAATLKAADSCSEMKKLCATVLVPTATLVTALTDRRLDSSVFATGLLIIMGLLDGGRRWLLLPTQVAAHHERVHAEACDAMP